MSVYVDDMRAPFGRMVMCHMVADTSDELHAMAERIGVKRRWCQYPGTPREHYDISQAKRALAVKAGAIEVSRRWVAARVRRLQWLAVVDEDVGIGDVALRALRHELAQHFAHRVDAAIMGPGVPQ